MTTERETRRRARLDMQLRRLRNAEVCALCGMTRGNVVHERDREHAPEGIDYYRDVPFCPFATREGER